MWTILLKWFKLKKVPGTWAAREACLFWSKKSFQTIEHTRSIQARQHFWIVDLFRRNKYLSEIETEVNLSGGEPKSNNDCLCIYQKTIMYWLDKRVVSMAIQYHMILLATSVPEIAFLIEHSYQNTDSNYCSFHILL